MFNIVLKFVDLGRICATRNINMCVCVAGGWSGRCGNRTWSLAPEERAPG